MEADSLGAEDGLRGAQASVAVAHGPRGQAQ